MKKRILNLMLVMAMLITCLPVIAQAASNGTCGENLTWTLEDGTLTIEGTGAMTNWSQVTNVPWYEIKQNINTIIINNDVTSIGRNAFKDCSALKSISIPDSVTTIYVSAFENCSALESISIPDSVTGIGSSAFKGCAALKSISIPNNVTIIYTDTFKGCTNLTNVTIPDSVTHIEASVFEGCSALESISLPDGIFVEEDVFKNCTALTRVSLPKKFDLIYPQAFEGCNNIKDVYYAGTKKDWDNTHNYINNYEQLKNAKIHYITSAENEIAVPAEIDFYKDWATGIKSTVMVGYDDVSKYIWTYKGTYRDLEITYDNSNNSFADGSNLLFGLVVPYALESVENIEFRTE